MLGAKWKSRTIGRAAYFWWCILGYVIAFAIIWTINYGQTYGHLPIGGRLNATEEDLVGYSISAALVGVFVIRVVTGIFRLRDIGWTSWFVLITLLPFVNNIFDIVLMLTSGRLRFDTASIKASQSTSGPAIRIGICRFAGTATLKTLIKMAYHVQDFQIEGDPSWVATQSYDVVAIADRLTNERLHLMLQALLADRFKLEIHHQGDVVVIDRVERPS
jgi:uncharacterized membrane protein YhaH (DUF805 family)